MPTRPMKFTRYCLIQWISKLVGSFEIHWVRQCLVNVVLFGTNDLLKSDMTVKLKSNLYIGPENIFPNFWHCNRGRCFNWYSGNHMIAPEQVKLPWGMWVNLPACSTTSKWLDFGLATLSPLTGSLATVQCGAFLKHQNLYKILPWDKKILHKGEIWAVCFECLINVSPYSMQCCIQWILYCIRTCYNSTSQHNS